MKIRTLEILEDIKPGGSEKGIKALKEAQKLEQKFIKEKKLIYSTYDPKTKTLIKTSSKERYKLYLKRLNKDK